MINLSAWCCGVGIEFPLENLILYKNADFNQKSFERKDGVAACADFWFTPETGGVLTEGN